MVLYNAIKFPSLANAMLVISPIVGALGSFMSGSATVSNLLFSSLQFETASILHLPEVLIVAAQTSGAALGNMICVNNVVAVCATVGCVGAEGIIIRRNAIPAFNENWGSKPIPRLPQPKIDPTSALSHSISETNMLKPKPVYVLKPVYPYQGILLGSSTEQVLRI